MVKKAPNLETAAEIRRVTRGYFGDPKGYEEILFRTRNNRYVLVQRAMFVKIVVANLARNLSPDLATLP